MCLLYLIGENYIQIVIGLSSQMVMLKTETVELTNASKCVFIGGIVQQLSWEGTYFQKLLSIYLFKIIFVFTARKERIMDHLILFVKRFKIVSSKVYIYLFLLQPKVGLGLL